VHNSPAWSWPIAAATVSTGSKKMPKPPDQHLSFEQYGQAADALHVLSGMLLFEFARHGETEATRDQIARNFIARADTMVRGIFRLWEINDHAD
jgi:hypothetical protein